MNANNAPNRATLYMGTTNVTNGPSVTANEGVFSILIPITINDYFFLNFAKNKVAPLYKSK
jgi:hypothetical protein